MPARRLVDDRLVVKAFDTDLGWMAIAVSGAETNNPMLARLTFGHRTRAAAASGLGLGNAAASAAKAWLKPLDKLGPGLVGRPWAELVERPWPELVERLTAYAAGDPEDFADVPVDLEHLTSMQRRVIDGCRRIPYGQSMTYGRLATLAGSPGAARAVGNVMAHCRCPLVIPCHRVVPAGGTIGRYSPSAGRRMKLRLLEQEGAWDGAKLRSPVAGAR